MSRLNRACITFILVLVATCAAGPPSAGAKVYSFKPAAAKGRSVVFVIDLDRVRPSNVRGARIRLGHYKPHRLTLAKARRAVRRGRLRVPIRPIVGGTETPSARSDVTEAAGQSTTLRIVADVSPPETKITSGPSGTVSTDSASLKFSSSERRSRFQCKRDSGEWSLCESPKSYSSLAAGVHTFSVRAIDRAGNIDPTPAARSWTVELPTAPPETPAEGAPMVDGFETPNGPNNLVTNEYAGWHSSDSGAVHSNVWRSDGGSLFSVPTTGINGEATRAAYTGRLDNSMADKYSESGTHSNKMRFWTKAGGYGDVKLEAQIKPMAWGAEAPSSWAGFKFYLRRAYGVTDSSFYTVEPFIKDGHLYIQKKCLGETGGGNYSSGGTYYVLASKTGYSTPLGSWGSIAATARTNADGSVTIGLYRDGALVLEAVDHGVRPDGTGCAPLGAGHVGFRSDYLQYYLDNFSVGSLS
jgi:hypothetical protein